MNNINEWFSSGLKLKRWFFLMVIGILFLSFSIAKFMISEELEIFQLVVCIAMFVVGFTSVIMSFVMSQRRILQAIAEANANPNGRNINLKKLLFDKRMLDKNIKIVAIGGGEGLVALLKALKIFSNNVTAVVSVVDDEKNSSENLSIQEIKKAMVALSSKESALSDFFTHRIASGELRGRNAGNVFFETLNDMCDNNLSKTVEHASKMLDMRGSVIPATLDNVTIGAVLTDGSRVIGKKNIEEKVEEKSVGIEKVFLVPERCAPAPEVIRSIKEADVIIIGPGSLYMGIIPTLLIKEISDTIRKSEATKIFVSNIMTEKNQTVDYALSDYINMIHEHAGKGLFNHCIFSDSDIMPEYIRRYNKEGADLIEFDKNKLKDMKLNIVVADLATVDDRNGIRHDHIKLAQSIFKIVCDNMDLEDNDKAIEYYTAKSKLQRMSNKNKKKSFWLSNVKVINPNKKRKRK
ncbi:MAG: YvcK family protein [Clostridia bacterium]|nr:YvcK family protein [Clostridia bacterium]